MKKIITTFFTISFVLLIMSCTKKISFAVSSVVPAARGFVKIKKDDNKNYIIQVQLTDLAEVKRLNESKEAYVIWMTTGNNETKNIGKINSSKTFIGGKLKASFETVSVIKPEKIFITAEENPLVQYPNSEIILTTGSF